MRIITRGPGPHPDVSVSGALVAVGDKTYDTEALQKESEKLIDLRRPASGEITEGGPGFQVASIQIPPSRAEEVITGKDDEDGNLIIELQLLPLNPDQVVITLWTTQK